MRKDMKTHSHKHWCKNMKAYMAKHEEMGNLPFTFMSGNVLEMGNLPFTFMSGNVLEMGNLPFTFMSGNVLEMGNLLSHLCQVMY